jgi:hypothetical protein
MCKGLQVIKVELYTAAAIICHVTSSDRHAGQISDCTFSAVSAWNGARMSCGSMRKRRNRVYPQLLSKFATRLVS